MAMSMKSSRRLANERGIALAAVMLMLVLMLLLGTAVVQVSMSEDLAATSVADAGKAFYAGETGLREAMYRMRLDPAALSDEGDTACSATADPVAIGKQGTPTTAWADPADPNFWKYNPPTCAWTYSGSNATGYGNYFGATAANLDSAGRTFTSSGSSHSGSGVLVNSTLTNETSYTVTVAPVVGYVGGCWQYVDQFGTPLGSCSSVAANPMYKVTATGTSRNVQKKLSAMIQHYTINPKLDGAITASSSVSIQSAAARVDGHNFDCDGNNPSDTGSVKAVTVPSGSSVSVNKDQNLECSAGTGTTNCAATSTPFPSTIGAYLLGEGAAAADIDALNAYLESIKISPANAPTSAFHGVVYIDGNYTQPPDGSSGVLIVHNSTNTANLGNFNGGTFKGLIIADQIQINGTAQVIGGVATFASVTTGEGNPIIKYSSCVIAGSAQNFPLHVVRGTWHRL